MKEEVEVARWRQDQIQARISGDSEALDLLNRADTHMNACRHKLSEAAGYPRWGNLLIFRITAVLIILFFRYLGRAHGVSSMINEQLDDTISKPE